MTPVELARFSFAVIEFVQKHPELQKLNGPETSAAFINLTAAQALMHSVHESLKPL